MSKDSYLPNPHLVDLSDHISSYSGMVVAGLGILVLIGWIFDLSGLKSVFPGLATMKFNTALLFVLSGISLTTSHSRRQVADTCAAITVIIAALTLFQYAFNWNFHIDELFVRDPATVIQEGVFPGRMSLMTAINFFLLGGSLCLLARRALVSQVLALSAGFLALLALAGYLYDVESLYSITPYSSMALHTALAFLVLALGVLFAKVESSLTRIFVSDSAGGVLIRRLLPVAFVVPLFLGWLRVRGQSLDVYAGEFGIALTIILNIIVFALVIWWTADHLHKVDIQRIEAEARQKQAYDELELRVQKRTVELTRANQTLQASEARFSGVLETAHDAVILVDKHLLITLFNHGAERIFGYKAEEVMNEPLNLLLPDRFHAVHAKHMVEFGKADPMTRIMAPDRLEVRGKRKTGQEFPADVSISSLNLNNERVFTAVVRDATERNQADDRFRTFLESAPDAVVIVNSDGKMVLVNAQTEKLFGYGREELIAQPVEKLIPEPFRGRHPAHREGYVADPHVRAMGIGLELFALRKDGSQFPVEISLSPIETPEGVLISAAIRDITERRQVAIKLREYANALERNNQELHMFAYTASHDLQEPLRKIQAFGDRLQAVSSDTLDERGQDYLARMVNASSRMKALIEDLLAYSRVSTQTKPFRPVDLEALIASVCSDLEIVIEKAGARIEVDELTTIDADETQMRQLFQNLISNAVKFRSPDRSPVIQITSRTIDAETSSLSDVPQCELVVSDNGIGFEEKFSSRIFGMFQRLHGRTQYEGTGIGLAICQKIVERHHGTIQARGIPGQGATFVVTIPVKQTQEEGISL